MRGDAHSDHSLIRDVSREGRQDETQQSREGYGTHFSR